MNTLDKINAVIKDPEFLKAINDELKEKGSMTQIELNRFIYNYVVINHHELISSMMFDHYVFDVERYRNYTNVMFIKR